MAIDGMKSDVVMKISSEEKDKITGARRDDPRTILKILIVIVIVIVLIVIISFWFFFMLGPGTGPFVLITMDEGSTDTNWTFTVLMLYGFEENPPLDELYITAYNEDGAEVLPKTRLSLLGCCKNNSGVWYFDQTQAGYLEVGDGFRLQKAIFGQGSEFALTNGAGETYGVYRA